MFRRLFGTRGPAPSPADDAPALPQIDPQDIAFLLSDHEGLPQLDWGMAVSWVERQDPDAEAQWRSMRAVAGMWLDALGHRLGGHARFRTARAEGLAPVDLVQRARQAVLASTKEVERALRPIRGDEPADPICVVAIGSYEQYVSLTSHFYAEEGEWATSGGVYLRSEYCAMPVIALPTTDRWGLENVIAHEFTHHCLVEANLPIWVEEGLTQMMEERVSGIGNYAVTAEQLDRHRRRWSESGLGEFFSGEAFASPIEDSQELSYHLAQMLVRTLLDRDARRFFAWARALGEPEALGDDGAWRRLAIEHLGLDPVDYARTMLRLPEGPDKADRLE